MPKTRFKGETMKAILITFILATGLTAQALSLDPNIIGSTLGEAFFSEGYPVTNQSYRGGNLYIDQSSRQLRLEIHRRTCPPFALCPADLPAPLILVLPILSTEVTPCGQRTIKAVKDERPADGALNIVTVVDNVPARTGVRCPQHYIVPRVFHSMIYVSPRNLESVEFEALYQINELAPLRR